MSGTAVAADLGSVIAAAHAAVDELMTAPLEPASEDELLDSWRELERLARRLPAVEHRFVNEARPRSLPGKFACRGMTQFLRQLLRLHPGEAKARAANAEAAGPRTALTGEPLPPVYPEIAAAQAEGAISPRHASLVVKTIQGLPDVVQVEHPELEAELVGHARRFDPFQCAKLAHRVTEPTTSSPGKKADGPPSTTAPWSAATITANTNASAGEPNSSTAKSGGSHPNGSTANRDPDSTISR